MDAVEKIFRTEDIETHALANIHLEVTRGEYLAIAGPSGCGKSTLMSILGLLDSPSGGSYTLNGQSVAELNHAQRARIRNREIGFIFQSFNLIGDLTVYENVELPLTYRGMGSAERRQKVNAALQRVAVARALSGDPLILLADEPTGNLDSKNGDDVMALLEELHGNGATICIVTHDPRYAHHAERTIHLFDGRVVAEPDAARQQRSSVSG